MKKFLACLLVAAQIICMLPGVTLTLAAEPDGSVENPYLITTVDELKAIPTTGLDKHYKLMADLDLSAVANWTPIAATGTKFTGTFDGNGHTVSNMKVTSVSGQCLGGLFGWIEYPAVIRNLTVENADITVDHSFGYTSFGGVVAAYNMGGTIDNCKVTGAISVTNAQAKTVYLGGIVGISKTNGADKIATIVNCISDVDITLTCPAGGATYIGGIAAQVDATGNTAYKAIIANCGSLGDITVNAALTANTYVGGIVGWMESNNNASATKSELHNCYFAGQIAGLTHAAYSVNTGAVYGRLRYTSVSNAYGLSQVAAAHPGVDIQGVASVTGMTADEMKASAFAQQLTTGAGNLNVALFDGSAIKLNAWTVDGGYPVLTLVEASPEDRWVNYASEALNGAGTQQDPYLIANAADLAYLAKHSNLTGYYQITADIDLSEREWVPIENFAGVLDGCNKSITGLWMGKSEDALNANTAGLFESINGATVKNINLAVSIYLAPTSAGKITAAGLVAKNTAGTLDNCSVSGVVQVDANSASGDAYVGGVSAQNYSSGADKLVKIMNCVNSATVTLNTKWAAADIKATYVAGIAADVSVKNADTSAWILNCANMGTIATNIAQGTYTQISYMGGIVGRFEDTNSETAVRGELHNCYNYGKIQGIAHKLDSATKPATQHYVGAVFGRNRYVNKSNLYYLQDSCATGGTNLKLEGDAIALPKDTLQSADFIVTMNNGAADANDALGTSLLGWKAVSGQYPVLTGEKPVSTPENKWTDSGKYSAALAGSGTQDDPYLISSAADLAYLAKKRNQSGYFRLMADIDLSAWEWVAIQGFTGTFDGNGHTVKGLWIGTKASPADETSAAMFESANQAQIKNLKLEVSIYLAPATAGKITAAGLVAKNTASTVDNCSVSGVVQVDANSASGDAYVGGVSAQNYSSGADKLVKIMNCVNSATVTLNTKWAAADIKATHVAGIAGDVSVKDADTSAWILNCANMGTIATNIAQGTYTQISYMGGIVGRFEDTNSENAVRGELHNCYNYGKIQGIAHKLDSATKPATQHYVGAVFGRNRYVNKSSLYYLEDTSAKGGTNLKLDGDAVALPKDKLQAASFIVTMNNGAADANDALGTSLLGWKAVSGQYPVLTGEKAVAIPENKWTDSGKYSATLAGSGTQDDPYLITSAADLAYLAKKRNQSGYFKLMTNIDLSAWEWAAIQGFTGTFDGNGYTIKGLWIGTKAKPADKTAAAMFENLNNGQIKNLKLTASIYLAPTTAGTITAAGLVAKNTSGTIDNCVVNGVVSVQANNKSGDAYVGGVTAQNYSAADDKIVKIMNCINNATVTLSTKWAAANIKATHVAGIAGDVSVKDANTSAWILNCANKGTITTNIAKGTYTQISYMGGIVGRFEDTNSETAVRGELHNCYNYGNIRGIEFKLDSSVKPTVQHYVGAVFGRNRYVNKSSLYYLEDSCAIGGKNLKLEGDAIGLPKAKLQSGDFIVTMNNGAADANDALGTSLLGWKAVAGQYPVLTSSRAVATPEGKWTDSGKYSAALAGSGTQANPYLIKSAADLAYLAKKRNQSGCFKLMADIDLSDWEWVAIQGFTGTFDGNGHTVKGLRIGTEADPADETTAGLFASATRATIKNLTLEVSIYIAPTTTNAITAAGLVARNTASLIDNCSVSGVVNVKANGGTLGVKVGGIAAAVISSWDGEKSKAYNAKLINCVNEADVTTLTCWKTRETDYRYMVGGVLGEAYAGNKNCSVWVINCANKGQVNASVADETYHYQAYIGGIAGWMEATSNSSTPLQFHNSINLGQLTGNITYRVDSAGYVQYVGAIFGRIRNAEVSNLYALYGTSDRSGRQIFPDGLNEDAGSFRQEKSIKLISFVSDLTKMARQLNQDMKISARTWEFDAEGWPTLGSDIAQGSIVTVNVNAERLGSASLQEQVSGQWQDATGVMFSKGETIRLAFEFTSQSCYIEKVTVNGNEVAVTAEDHLELQIQEDTQIDVEFGLQPATKTVELYVKSDAAQGGDGSQEKPFATLKEAVDRIESILQEDANININVNLMDGKYVLQETLVLGKSHSALAKVTFKNVEGASPIITSGQQIDSSKFAPVEGKDYYAFQFTEADKVDGEYPQFRDLQIDGKSAVMAKTDMYTFTANVTDDGAFAIPKELLAGINNENLEGAQMVMASEYQTYGMHYGSIEEESGKYAKLYIEASDWEEYLERVRSKRNFAGRTYFLQNHIAYLDEPGEFYYNRNTGTIYYYPYADQELAECTVEYAALDSLIYMEDAYNFVFDGLTFTGTSNNRYNDKAMLFGNGGHEIFYYDEGPMEVAGAICGTYTSELTVRNCTFTELDTGAIVFEYGVKGFDITGNTFRELGMYAIMLGAKQLVWNSNDMPGGVENVLISNNYIDHIGLEILCSAGIRIGKAVNLKLLHNTIKNVPYTGIGVGMGFTLVQPGDNFINMTDVEIAYNHVENFMYNGNDGGAIYICGANATVDYTEYDRVSIHDNYIKGNGYDKISVGIYHDGSASNVHTYNNVIVDVASTSHGIINTQWHVANQYCHNILIENNYSTIQGPRCGLSEEEYNVVMRNNQSFDDISQFPAEALAIIEAAGVEADYAVAIKPVTLEMTTQDITVHYDITRYGENNRGLNAIAHFQLTNNDTVERTLQLVIEGLPEGVSYKVKGDGVALQPGESTDVTVKFIADPDTFEASRGKQMLKLNVVEEDGRKMSYPKAVSFILKQLSADYAQGGYSGWVPEWLLDLIPDWMIGNDFIDQAEIDAKKEVVVTAMLVLIVVLAGASVTIVIIMKKKKKQQASNTQ